MKIGEDNRRSPEGPRLRNVAALLSRVRNSFRYVDYRQAERDCELLASRMLQVWTRAELRSVTFAAIPRGGLIVLGMLSYVLDLEADQLRGDPLAAERLVIVDDCALTGARFTTFLAGTASSTVAFVHLYSHPQLREALVGREPRVRHCIAAHDLADKAREIYPIEGDLLAWRSRWQDRLGPGRLWIGIPELVCFAWSEPDAPFWNPATGRVEDGWRFLPPQDCLKNRARLGVPPAMVREPTLQVPALLVTGRFDGVLWLCRSDTLEVYRLDGTADEMWRTLAAYGDLEAAAMHLLRQYDVGEEQLLADLRSFARELVDKGLLIEVKVPPSGGL